MKPCAHSVRLPGEAAANQEGYADVICHGISMKQVTKVRGKRGCTSRNPSHTTEKRAIKEKE